MRAQVWKEMESLVDDKLTKAIGVRCVARCPARKGCCCQEVCELMLGVPSRPRSNFRVGDLEPLVRSARIAPAVNQIEAHPYLQQPQLKKFCEQHGERATPSEAQLGGCAQPT